MRVWMIDPRNYTPYYDYALSRALQNQGCDVRLVTSPFAFDDLPAWDDLAVDHLFRRPSAAGQQGSWERFSPALSLGTYPIQWLRLYRRAVVHQPDIVHVQWTPAPFVDFLFLHALRRARTVQLRLVYTAHNILPHERRPWHDQLYRAVYGVADQLIVHSRAAASELVSRFGLADTRIHVIPEGNLFDFAKPVPRRQARQALDVPSTTPVVLFFGIVRPYKGLLHLLHAMPRVRSELPDAKLFIVGHVHRNTDMRPYHACIEELDLAGVVKWHPRYVPHAELGTFFGAADVVALPYVSTTDSAVVTTAYTFGRPVVTTATGGLPEVVKHGRSGLLVPPGDVDALAQSIIQVLSDAGLRRCMGRYARRLAETRHAWPAIAQATREVYDTSLNVEYLGQRRR